MIEIEPWLERFTQVLRKTFGERVWFAGLQGSYARGEATESSDIDPVVILDVLTAEDIGNIWWLSVTNNYVHVKDCL